MPRLSHSFALSVAAAFSLASCVTPDPVYQRNFAAIPDTGFPPGQIVGDWMQFGLQRGNVVSPSTGNMIVLTIETKVYLHLNKDGTGVTRRTITRSDESQPVISETPLTWVYLGRNRWQINVLGGQGHFESNPSWHEGRMLNIVDHYVMRFYQDRLYPEGTPNTYVRADDAAVRAQLRAIRAMLP